MEHLLARCADWSRTGRHRKILEAIENLLPSVTGHPGLEAHLLVWKAQALLAMGSPERATAAASRSWELEVSSHACHLMAACCLSRGDTEEAEQFLRAGLEEFPEAVHLSFRLAVVLAEEGRMPEALEVVDDINLGETPPDDLSVFRFGLRANLLAALGRWQEAKVTLDEGLSLHPEAALLREANELLVREHDRRLAEKRLTESWTGTMTELDGVAATVDEEISLIVLRAEIPEVVALAARRLWRAFSGAVEVSPRAPRAWAAACLAAVFELDDAAFPTVTVALLADASPATVRSILRRIRAYLGTLDRAFVLRSFAGRTNPRLSENVPATAGSSETARVLHFPKPERSEP